MKSDKSARYLGLLGVQHELLEAVLTRQFQGAYGSLVHTVRPVSMAASNTLYGWAPFSGARAEVRLITVALQLIRSEYHRKEVPNSFLSCPVRLRLCNPTYSTTVGNRTTVGSQSPTIYGTICCHLWITSTIALSGPARRNASPEDRSRLSGAKDLPRTLCIH